MPGCWLPYCFGAVANPEVEDTRVIGALVQRNSYITIGFMDVYGRYIMIYHDIYILHGGM